MAVAMVYPEPEKTTHGKKSKTKLLLETTTYGWWSSHFLMSLNGTVLPRYTQSDNWSDQ
jgi:hypothetical protein